MDALFHNGIEYPSNPYDRKSIMEIQDCRCGAKGEIIPPEGAYYGLVGCSDNCGEWVSYPPCITEEEAISNWNHRCSQPKDKTKHGNYID